MASPNGIVNGQLRKLAAGPDPVTNVRQLPLANAAEHSPPLTLSWPNLLAPPGLGVILPWTFVPTAAELPHNRSTEPEHSHGYLVPLYSL
jgi:hypothetical protein